MLTRTRGKSSSGAGCQRKTTRSRAFRRPSAADRRGHPRGPSRCEATQSPRTIPWPPEPGYPVRSVLAVRSSKTRSHRRARADQQARPAPGVHGRGRGDASRTCRASGARSRNAGSTKPRRKSKSSTRFLAVSREIPRSRPRQGDEDGGQRDGALIATTAAASRFSKREVAPRGLSGAAEGGPRDPEARRMEGRSVAVPLGHGYRRHSARGARSRPPARDGREVPGSLSRDGLRSFSGSS